MWEGKASFSCLVVEASNHDAWPSSNEISQFSSHSFSSPPSEYKAAKKGTSTSSCSVVWAPLENLDKASAYSMCWEDPSCIEFRSYIQHGGTASTWVYLKVRISTLANSGSCDLCADQSFAKYVRVANCYTLDYAKAFALENRVLLLSIVLRARP